MTGLSTASACAWQWAHAPFSAVNGIVTLQPNFLGSFSDPAISCLVMWPQPLHASCDLQRGCLSSACPTGRLRGSIKRGERALPTACSKHWMSATESYFGGGEYSNPWPNLKRTKAVVCSPMTAIQLVTMTGIASTFIRLNFAISKSTVFLRVSENTTVRKLWPNEDLFLASSVILFSAFKPQLDNSHSLTSWCCHFSLTVRILTILQIYLQTYSLGTLITCITKEMPGKTDM